MMVVPTQLLHNHCCLRGELGKKVSVFLYFGCPSSLSWHCDLSPSHKSQVYTDLFMVKKIHF